MCCHQFCLCPVFCTFYCLFHPSKRRTLPNYRNVCISKSNKNVHLPLVHLILDILHCTLYNLYNILAFIYLVIVVQVKKAIIVHCIGKIPLAIPEIIYIRHVIYKYEQKLFPLHKLVTLGRTAATSFYYVIFLYKKFLKKTL